MVRRSKAPPYKPTPHHPSPPHHCAAPTGNDGRSGAPYTSCLPAVKRAWDDKWRVLCIGNIRTRLVVEAPFLIWGVGRHLRLPFHLSARNNLDFTTRNNPGISLTHLGGPRRNQNTLQTKAKWWSRQPTDTNLLFIHHQAFPPARVPACDRRARVQRKDLVGSRSGATTRIARLPSPA